MNSKPCDTRLRPLRALGLGALATATLTLSACGGGGAISGGVPPGPVCNSTTGVAAGDAMGTCSSATALISLRRAIDASVTIAPGPSYSVALPLPGGDPIPTHNLDATDISTLNTLGDVRGLYLQKDDGVAGAYIAIGDFAGAVDRTSGNSKFAGGALSYTNFGLWERFVSASEGYYGGWYLPRNSGAANPELPTTGSATYTGVLVGALAPVNGNPPLYGLSGAISLTTNFQTSAVNGTMSGFVLSNQLLPGPVAAPINPVNLSGSIAGNGLSFAGTMPAGGGSGAASGTFQGAFFGPSAAGGPPEVAGRFQFVTPDAQQIVGAFGARQ